MDDDFGCIRGERKRKKEMSDFISRDAVIDIIANCQDIAPKDRIIAVEAIEAIPSTDVRKNAHGEWRDTGSGQECSVCREIQYGYDTGRSFCANCGADMRDEN